MKNKKLSITHTFHIIIKLNYTNFLQNTSSHYKTKNDNETKTQTH